MPCLKLTQLANRYFSLYHKPSQCYCWNNVSLYYSPKCVPPKIRKPNKQWRPKISFISLSVYITFLKASNWVYLKGIKYFFCLINCTVMCSQSVYDAICIIPSTASLKSVSRCYCTNLPTFQSMPFKVYKQNIEKLCVFILPIKKNLPIVLLLLEKRIIEI